MSSRSLPMCRSYLLVLLCLSLIAAGCNTAPDYWTEAKPTQKKVLVSFPPFYSFTHAVAGDDAYVLCMLAAQGPHGHDFAQTDMLKVNKADLFIYNGLTLDDLFVDKMLREHKNKSIHTLNVGATLEEKHSDLMLPGEGHVHVVNGIKHIHGAADPHVWLGPDRAIAMTKIIADKLVAMDPAKEKGYRARADKYVAELKKLDAEGKAAFQGKKVKMVTMHEAFGYFADAFGITIVATIQKMPGLDPDAASMARLIKVCKEEKVSIIAVEPQYSEAQAKELQSSLKKGGIEAKIVTLDPLETATIPEGRKFNPEPDFYLKKMRENIAAIVKALP